MRTIATSPLQTEPIASTLSRSRNRISIMLVAFWHTLRRDIMVTAREFIPFLLQVLVMPFSLLAVFGRILARYWDDTANLSGTVLARGDRTHHFHGESPGGHDYAHDGPELQSRD